MRGPLVTAAVLWILQSSRSLYMGRCLPPIFRVRTKHCVQNGKLHDTTKKQNRHESGISHDTETSDEWLYSERNDYVCTKPIQNAAVLWYRKLSSMGRCTRQRIVYRPITEQCWAHALVDVLSNTTPEIKEDAYAIQPPTRL